MHCRTIWRPTNAQAGALLHGRWCIQKPPKFNGLLIGKRLISNLCIKKATIRRMAFGRAAFGLEQLGQNTSLFSTDLPRFRSSNIYQNGNPAAKTFQWEANTLSTHRENFLGKAKKPPTSARFQRCLPAVQRRSNASKTYKSCLFVWPFTGSSFALALPRSLADL